MVNQHVLTGNRRYVELAPSEFKEGDVVEAAVAFMAYPLPQDGDVRRYKMVVALRALSLLSSEFREVRNAVPRDILSNVTFSDRNRFARSLQNPPERDPRDYPPSLRQGHLSANLCRTQILTKATVWKVLVGGMYDISHRLLTTLSMEKAGMALYGLFIVVYSVYI